VAGRWVSTERQEGNHLLVRKLVPLGHLQRAVQGQHCAVRAAAQHLYPLVRRLLVKQDRLHLERKGLGRSERAAANVSSQCEPRGGRHSATWPGHSVPNSLNHPGASASMVACQCVLCVWTGDGPPAP
jgi:hypothetical protein